MTEIDTDKLRALDEGPQLQRIQFTCEGCKHLTTEDWEEYPDGERDSGTSAWCNAGEKRNLSAYWSPSHQPPSTCPFPTPAILAMAEERKRCEAHRNDLADMLIQKQTEIGALKAEVERISRICASNAATMEEQAIRFRRLGKSTSELDAAVSETRRALEKEQA